MHANAVTPQEVNWHAKGAVDKVKNPGQVGQVSMIVLQLPLRTHTHFRIILKGFTLFFKDSQMRLIQSQIVLLFSDGSLTSQFVRKAHIIRSFSGVSPTVLHQFSIKKIISCFQRVPRWCQMILRAFSNSSKRLPSPSQTSPCSDRSPRNYIVSQFDLNQLPSGSHFILVLIPYPSHVFPVSAQMTTLWEPAGDGFESIVCVVIDCRCQVYRLLLVLADHISAGCLNCSGP